MPQFRETTAMVWEMGKEMLYLGVALNELLSKHNHPERDLKTEMEQWM